VPQQMKTFSETPSLIKVCIGLKRETFWYFTNSGRSKFPASETAKRFA